MDWLNPEMTYQALLIVQALHLLHHRIAKRHISLVEGFTAVVLCVQPGWFKYGVALATVHIALIIIQLVGSVWIKRLSPSWSASND